MDSSRFRFFARGSAAGFLVACTACSSSSSPAPGAPGDGGGSGITDAGEPIVDGDGAPCTPQTSVTVGTKVSLNVTWPGTAAVAKSSGQVFIWLLSTYNIDATTNKITGTTNTCSNADPPITLTKTGDLASGVPEDAGMGQVAFQFPTSSYAGTPSTSITGQFGGWNINSTMRIDPVVTLYGLAPTSMLDDPTVKWPTMVSSIAATDLTYSSGMPFVMGVGQPGIYGAANSMPPFYPPKTSLDPTSPAIDAVYVVTRTQLSLYGTATTCTDISGDAIVGLLNNRVVGCHLAGEADDAGACSSDQYGFIDSNTTQYVPGTGTFASKQMTAGATCDDVLTMLP
jgi:hypothetical protein